MCINILYIYMVIILYRFLLKDILTFIISVYSTLYYFFSVYYTLYPLILVKYDIKNILQSIYK